MFGLLPVPSLRAFGRIGSLQCFQSVSVVNLTSQTGDALLDGFSVSHIGIDREIFLVVRDGKIGMSESFVRAAQVVKNYGLRL